MIQKSFDSFFSLGNGVDFGLFLKVEWTELAKFNDNTGRLSELPSPDVDFHYLVPFPNHSNSKATAVLKSRLFFGLFDPPL